MNPVVGLVQVEPTVTRRFLPRCPQCLHPHPLAHPSTAHDPDHCPRCEGPAAEPGPEYTEHVELTDPISRLAMWFINAGNRIYASAVRLRDRAEGNDQ